MTNCIICVTLKGDFWIIPYHPFVKSIVQKQISKKRSNDRSLRNALVPFYLLSLFCLIRNNKPSVDIQQHPVLISVLEKRFVEQVMIYVIKESFDIHIQYPIIFPATFPSLSKCIMSRPLWAIPIRIFMKYWFQLWLQYFHNYHLGYSVRYSWDSKRSFAPSTLWYLYQLDSRRHVTA